MAVKKSPGKPDSWRATVRDEGELLPLGSLDKTAITEDVFRRFHPDFQAYLLHKELSRFDLQDALEVAEKRAITDELTNLITVRGLKQHVAELGRRQQEKDKEPQENRRSAAENAPISVIFIDLNDFGLINKVFGDPVGDAAIQAVADYFTKNLRWNEDRVSCISRKGGDELLVTMHCSKQQAEKKLQSLREGFSAAVAQGVETRYRELPQAEGSEWEGKVQDYQNALAEKHENPALKRKPFGFSFSFGVKELSNKELKALASENKDEFYKAFYQMIAAGDEAMRGDKTAHKAAMRSYSDDSTPEEPGKSAVKPRRRQPASSSR